MSQESITFDEMDNLCEIIVAQRSIVDALSAQKKEEDKKLDELEKKLLELMNKTRKTSYPSPQGTFSISHRLSVKIPSTPEDRTAFFEYLKGRGLFDNMASIHSATLNSFYKAEFEAAKDRGEGLDFALPGIGVPTVNEIVSFRAKK